MNNIQTLLKKRKNKKLLVIFPHPDDESVMAAGLMQAALARKWNVRVVSLTHGEAGKMHIHGKGKSLKEIRKLEYEHAMRKLGVNDYSVQAFPDGGLMETKQPWQMYVWKEIESFQPGVIVTYDPTGITGHPDHVVLSFEISRVLHQLKEQKSAHVPQLIWPAYQGLPKKRMYHPELFDSAPKPSHHLVLSPAQVLKKYQALIAHQSQRVGKSQPLPLWLVMVLFGKHEYFTLAPLTKPTEPKYIEFAI